MHSTPEPGPRSRTRAGRALAIVGALALMIAVLPAGLANAWSPRTFTVHPGQSIQDAVNKASNGDIIKLVAGTYANQAVCVVNKGLTIVGAGRDKTRITWPQWTTPPTASSPGDQAPAPRSGNACWQEWASHDPESAGSAQTQQGLSDDVSALFFLSPRGPVMVAGLSTFNHPANGIVIENGNGVGVVRTGGNAHDRYGILTANTTNILIKDNVEIGKDRGTADAPNSGTAGIGISDSAKADAGVYGNYSQGWNLGLFVREARTGQLAGNTSTGNCVGINLFDDGNTEVPPNPNSTIAAGNWSVVGNRVVDNHRFCLAGIGQVEGTLRVSGTGVSVVNMDTVLIKDNQILNNSPRADIDPTTLQFPPGGLTLLTLRLFNTSDPGAAGPVHNVTVVGNTLRGNVFVDVLLGPPPGTPPPDVSGLEPVDAQANKITFSRNSCSTSYPPGTAGCGA